jgi:hypothetical protein
MDEIQKAIQALLDQGSYEFTEHAMERMDEDQIEEEEIFSALANACVTKKQKDPKKEARWIYTLYGKAYSRRWIYIAAKIVAAPQPLFRILSAKEESGHEE